MKIPSTIEAAALCKTAETRQTTGVVLGPRPLAFDNAIDPEAAESRASDRRLRTCQILIVPVSRPATCSPRPDPFMLKADAAGLVLGVRGADRPHFAGQNSVERGSPSLCSGRVSMPMPVGARQHSAHVRRTWTRSWW